VIVDSCFYGFKAAENSYDVDIEDIRSMISDESDSSDACGYNRQQIKCASSTASVSRDLGGQVVSWVGHSVFRVVKFYINVSQFLVSFVIRSGIGLLVVCTSLILCSLALNVLYH
jgi:hypothetical protein